MQEFDGSQEKIWETKLNSFSKVLGQIQDQKDDQLIQQDLIEDHMQELNIKKKTIQENNKINGSLL